MNSILAGNTVERRLTDFNLRLKCGTTLPLLLFAGHRHGLPRDDGPDGVFHQQQRMTVLIFQCQNGKKDVDFFFGVGRACWRLVVDGCFNTF